MKKQGILFLIFALIISLFILTLNGCDINSSSSESQNNSYESDKFSTIKWPDSHVAKMLPTPESTIGRIDTDRDDYLWAYIGNTSLDDYENYVENCKTKGFVENYDKGSYSDDSTYYYRADHVDGYHLSLEYHVKDKLDSYKPLKETLEIYIEKGNTESTEDTTEFSQESTKEVETTTIEPTTKKTDIFPLENAKRAAVVTLTNGIASDVYAEDGFSIDKSKLHSYSDLSGDYIVVDDWGEWKEKDNNTWHVENLKGTTNYNNIVNASLDVKYNNKFYTVFNINGTHGNNNLKDIEETKSTKDDIINVDPKLIKDNRSNTSSEEKSANTISHYYAKRAFEKYGNKQFPNGFKCHWILKLYNDEHSSDGSYIFKVGVTVTNSNNKSQKMIAEGIVSGTDEDPNVTNFFVY